jgi:hypothetical protein
MAETQSTKAQTENCGCQAGPHITCRRLRAAFVSNFDGRPTTDPCNDCGELPEAHDASLSSRRFLVRLANGGGIYSACDREGAERVSADWADSKVTDQEPTRTVKTGEIKVGDVVREHGMRVRIDSIKTYEDRGLAACACRGTVLNLDEVLADKIVPASFLRTERREDGKGWVTDRRDAWTVQGNDLASWRVEA